MKVSIIIPVYNVSDYIERCLHSVIEQSYTDVECILVDDCTPDDSIEKCERIISDYKGPICFKILHHRSNRGLSAARNTGTNAATGEYVFFLDSDDEITPDCIKCLIQVTVEHPKVEIVQGATISIPYDKYYDTDYFRHPCYIEDNNELIRYNFFKYGDQLPINAWNKLIKKNVVTDNNIEFLYGLIHEDELWSMQLALVVSNYAITNEPTYIHYVTENSIMSTLNKCRSARNMMRIVYAFLPKIKGRERNLQLCKCLAFLMTRYEDAGRSVARTKATMMAIVMSLKFGYKRISVRMLKLLCGVGDVNSLKYNVMNRWQMETDKANPSLLEI